VIRRTAFTVAVVALLALAAVVVIDLLRPAPALTPAQQAGRLEAELRCPDCQGLSVAESHTTSAAAIRNEVTRQLQAGRTPAEVRDYFVARYGQWILLEPSSPAWFWIPLGLVAVGAVGLVLWLRAGRRIPPGPPAETARPEDDAVRRRVRDEVEALDA
jgi:cytochrome c-type biogenesis protein CcmH